MASYRNYQEALAVLTADGEGICVRTTGGHELSGTLIDAGPHLLRLDAEGLGTREHLVNPFQIAAITVKVAEA